MQSAHATNGKFKRELCIMHKEITTKLVKRNIIHDLKSQILIYQIALFSKNILTVFSNIYSIKKNFYFEGVFKLRRIV